MLMKRLLSRQFACFLALIGLAFFSGCGNSLPPLVPVSGKVTLEGKPFTEGSVTLIPEANNLGGLAIVGPIDSTGQYTVTTNGKEGAPEGKYKVIVVAPPKVDPKAKKGALPEPPINKKFADVNKTTLGFQVTANAAPGAYDLKLTKK
jgi:hypothetical protein